MNFIFSAIVHEMHLRNDETMCDIPDSTASHTDKSVNHRSNVSQKLLDLFWVLAATNEEERIEASASLLQLVEKDCEKKTSDVEQCSSLHYTLRRLLTGLSSSRQAAPLGFATALCELLSKFESRLKLSELLSLLMECLQATKQDNRAHHSHCSLGRILAYSSIIRSGMIKKASSEDLRLIVEDIASIRGRFSMLGAITTECLTQLSTAVDADKLRDIITEVLNEELTKGWERCTPDTLQLLMVLQDENILDSEYLSENWETDKLVGKKTLPHLARVMIQSICHHPIIHPVNSMIVERAASAGHKLFNKLWKNVIIGEVYSTDKHSRSYMVYHIIPDTLKSRAKQQCVSSILCPELIGPLMKQMTNREAYLHKAAIKLMADLVDVVKTTEDASLQLEILRCLMTDPGSYMFDSITTSRSLSNIISHLSKDAASEFAGDLMNVISTETALCGRRGDGLISWCSLTLVHMLTLPSVTHNASDDSWQTEILKLLLTHSCFSVSQPLPSLGIGGGVNMNTTDRASMKEALLKGLNVLSTYQNVNKGKTASINYTSILDSLFKYAVKLVKSSPEVEPLRGVSSEEMKVWEGVGKTCKQIAKHRKEAGEDKSKSAMFEAFQLMLQLFGLHIFIVEESERREVIDTIQEISLCFQKAVSRTRSKKEEPEWCEVITEVLISLMSKSSHLLRAVSVTVFNKILPMCNTSSIQLILDVFQSEDDEFDADKEDDGEDEEMMSPDDADTSTVIDEEGEDDAMSSSDDSDDDDDEEEEEEEGEEVNDHMRATIQAALGSAAATESGEEDADLSDSEMFKLDDALSEAFRSMRRKSKNSPEELEKKRQVIHFKLRCLDLIDIVVKQSTKGEHLLEVIVPLLSIIESGYKDKELMEIGKKAQTIYSHLTSLRKLPSSTITDLDDVTQKVKDVLTISTNAYVWPIMKEISSALNLMIKLLSHSELKGEETTNKSNSIDMKELLVTSAVGQIKAALAHFLNKRESRYSNTLFQYLFERQPMLFWDSSKVLLEAISNKETRIFCRTQACCMLAQLINRTTSVEVGETSWREFTVSLQSVVTKVGEFMADSYKPGFLLELFNLLQRVKSADTQLVLDLNSYEAICGKFNKDLQKLYKKLRHQPLSQSTTSVRRKRKSSVTSHTESVKRAGETKQSKTPKTV